MSQIFVWKPSASTGLPAADRGAARFQNTLEGLRTRHEAAFARPFSTSVVRVGEVWIGQLHTDLGVPGWSPWLEREGKGVAWSGICEHFLGADPGAVIAEACRAAFERPQDAAEWQGAHAAVAWDQAPARVAVLVSSSEPQSMWVTEGPDGWAAGSRARPLLDLVGRAAELDEIQATLFLGFGYLAGDGCLFRGVQRVPSGRRILLLDQNAPQLETPLSVAEYLARADTRGLGFDEAIPIAAERFAQRVARQLRHSPTPTLSLTGGRDSRSLAAALHAAGFRGPVKTGGARDAPDVVVARRVSRELGFEHRATGSGDDLLARMIEHSDRTRLWMEVTEGIETVRHALHFRRLFEPGGDGGGAMPQTFNGLNPGLRAPGPGKWGRDAVLDRIGPSLRHASAARDHLAGFADRVQAELHEVGGDPEDFPELFYWQHHALQWGQDNVSTKFGLTLWWTPLMDGSLVRTCWWLPREDKPPKVFVEGITEHLAPQLEGIPYEHVSRPNRLQRYWRQAQRRAPWLLGPSKLQAFRPGPERREHWEWFLFERARRVWPDLVDEAHVRSMLDANLDARLLWSVATLELFVETHLESPRSVPTARPDGMLDAAPSRSR